MAHSMTAQFTYDERSQGVMVIAECQMWQRGIVEKLHTA